jgi:hypothetical protein
MKLTPVLFHVSSIRWSGETVVTLRPGPQGAEGTGVYFSEGQPRFSAAEGTQRSGGGAVFVVSPSSPKTWWRSKGSAWKKHGRPRTWRTLGVSITLADLHQVGEINGLPLVAGKEA